MHERDRARFEDAPPRGCFVRWKATASIQVPPLRVQRREGMPVPKRSLLDGAAVGAKGSALVQVQTLIGDKSPYRSLTPKRRRKDGAVLCDGLLCFRSCDVALNSSPCAFRWVLLTLGNECRLARLTVVRNAKNQPQFGTDAPQIH